MMIKGQILVLLYRQQIIKMTLTVAMVILTGHVFLLPAVSYLDGKIVWAHKFNPIQSQCTLMLISL